MPRARASYAMPSLRRRVSGAQALRGLGRVVLRGLAGLGQGGSALSAAQIQQYAANAGFTGDDLNTAVAIALAESSGIPTEIGDKTLAPANGPSYGLWQINIGTNANPQFASWNLTDPQTNANAAYSIYQAWGNMFGAWSTFTSGAYLAYLSQVPSVPLTIDASTGLPVLDLTPTPSAAVGGIDTTSLLYLAGGVAAVYVLADVLSDL
jgi:Lysozyme like domain